MIRLDRSPEAAPIHPVPLLTVLVVLALACGEEGQKSPPDVPDPLIAARELLALHDLLGRQPDERTAESQEQEIDRAALTRLVADLEHREPFISDLYVGFVVGALARFQDRLVATVIGSRATIVAGRARIVLQLDNGKWKFVLEESVPAEIKERATAEKRRYEAAQTAADR